VAAGTAVLKAPRARDNTNSEAGCSCGLVRVAGILLPAGDASGLPAGIQLWGPPGSDDLVLAAAAGLKETLRA
jgi:Asp-tRNA(Asn)/Glu-tRNA(Gln) amidotransferase A subunit family amidase